MYGVAAVIDIYTGLVIDLVRTLRNILPGIMDTRTSVPSIMWEALMRWRWKQRVGYGGVLKRGMAYDTLVS